MIRSIAILLFLSFWLGGCNLLNPEKETIVLAKIGDKSLFLSEIQPSIPENFEGADSALFVKEQVKKWITYNKDICEHEKKIREQQLIHDILMYLIILLHD